LRFVANIPSRWLALIWLLSCLTASAALASEMRGRVVAVHDGDTLTLLQVDHRQIKIRLTEIDAPEAGQAWGARSKQALSALVFGKDVSVVERGHDRYGRTLGRIYVGRTDVSAEMVKSGSAWAFTKYLTDQNMVPLEAEARNARRGLWSMPMNEIVAPWDWRAAGRGGQGKRANLASAVVDGPAFGRGRPFTGSPREMGEVAIRSAGFACGAKRYCGEMSSCGEAKFYLLRCGLSRLDGNHDGVPCEKICAP
jgi:endonuclease YncB( thermonuclease family)